MTRRVVRIARYQGTVILELECGHRALATSDEARLKREPRAEVDCRICDLKATVLPAEEP